MDSLLPILLLVVFFVLRALGSRKPQHPDPSQLDAPPASPDASSDDEMDLALRQIREALGMPVPPQPAPPPLLPDQQVRPVPALQRSLVTDEFKPYRAEAAERLPARTAKARQPRLITLPDAATKPESADSGAAVARLLNTETAQQAFVLSEILAAPRSRRPLR